MSADALYEYASQQMLACNGALNPKFA